MANPSNDQTNKAAGAAREAANEAAHTARAGADLAHRGVETARDNMQAGLDTAAQSFQRMTDQFTNVLGFSGPQAEALARRSSQNLQAVSQAASVLARGFQEASHKWLGLAQERVKENIDGLNQLAGCRSVQDFVAVQSDLVRERFWQVIDTNKRVAELAIRVAEEAGRIIQAQAAKTADRVRRAA